MKVDRRYFRDLQELAEHDSITVRGVDLNDFFGKALYFKRLQKYNGFKTLDDLFKSVRGRKTVVGSRYVELI